MPDAKILAWGLVVDGPVLPRWQARCIEELDGVEGARLRLLVTGAASTSPRRNADEQEEARSSGLRRRLEHALLSGCSPAVEPVDLSHRLENVPVRVEGDGGVQSGRMSDEAIRAVEEGELDFVLDLSRRGIRGGVVRLPRHGFWRFRHGNPFRHPAGPVGFWEIVEDDPVTVSVLQRVTGDPARSELLQRSRVGTVDDSLSQNRDRILMASVGWPARTCREILLNEGGPRFVRAPARQRLGGRDPDTRDLLRLGWKLFRNYVRGLKNELVRHEDWSLGMVPHPPEIFMERPEGAWVRWLDPAPEDHYWADPFGMSDGERVWILAEEFDFENGKGRLVGLDTWVPRGGSSDPGAPSGIPETLKPLALEGIPTAEDGSVHMSYPYLFRHEGEIYCVPETCGSRAARLYRALRFPDRWEHVSTPVQDFPVVDPTVFRHDGRWWLLGTDLEGGSHSHLHAWWAPELEGPWSPHPLNPLKIDVRSARPAGTPFRHHGALIRPAQDCSVTYGRGIALNRVEELTPTSFRETTVSYLRPDPDGPYPDGLHTLSRVGDYTLVDGKRWIFSPTLFRQRLRKRMGSVLGRLPVTPRPSSSMPRSEVEPSAGSSASSAPPATTSTAGSSSSRPE